MIAICVILLFVIAFKKVKVGIAITIWEAIQKRSHEPIYKTYKKKISKGLKSDNFAIAKLEER